MGVIFGGPDSRKIVKRGEFMCSLQYIDEQEAALFAARHRNRGVANPPVIAVLLTDAYRWEDTQYVAKAAKEMVEILGFEPSAQAAYAFARFVNDMLGELFHMKPLPDDMRQQVPEVEIQQLDDARFGAVIH
jgi:hypothetical protein